MATATTRPTSTARTGSQNGRAVRRAAPVPQLPAAARVKASRLPAGHPLRTALGVLQLAQVPGSLPELVQHCTALHPEPSRTWGWGHRDAYAVLFDLICAGTGSTARSRGAARTDA